MPRLAMNPRQKELHRRAMSLARRMVRQRTALALTEAEFDEVREKMWRYEHKKPEGSR